MKHSFSNGVKTFKNYCLNQSGQFAIWFGVAAFPILVATTYVVDFRGVEKDRAGIKSALDAAVLTAVSNDSVTMVQKEDLAIEVFNAHYAGEAQLKLMATATDGRVEMSAKGVKTASLSRSVGVAGFDVSELSIAEMNRDNTICVLALANDGQNRLRFLDETKFNSPTCSVQSNSRDKLGVLSSTSYTPIAKSFCSAGGAKGGFSPSMRGECRIIDDPYETRKTPAPGVCMPTSVFATVEEESSLGLPLGLTLPLLDGHEPWVRINDTGAGKHEHQHCHIGKVNCHSSNHKVGDLHLPNLLGRLAGLGVPEADLKRLKLDYGEDNLLVPESLNFSGNNKIFYPGTYCGGLTVNGTNVVFMPGTYIIKDGPLTFKNGAVADAMDVSFVLTGEGSVVTVESGSYVTIKAPKRGNMAGLAFFQDRDDTVFLGHGKSQKSAGVTGVNLISSGGELNVTGTMYFPTQALEVIGDSVLGAKSPATSFIAYQVTFAGETIAEVSVDHVKGGIPPLLPRSDDGARLVK